VNPLISLREQGQAVWLDFLSRRFVAEGGLKRLVQNDGLAGVTSNPAIFKKAIAGSNDYDSSLAAVTKDGDADVMSLYERLAIADIKNAADVLRTVYDATGGNDGFVSLEVSPYLANDTAGTVAEARRLWDAVGRANLMIKVPGTPAGLPAIRQLLGEGINVNITLLFSCAVYREVVEAYLSGLEHHHSQGGDLKRIASVASFFVSRIDSAVDRLIDERIKTAPGESQALAALRGKIAIANAKLAYRHYQRLFAGARWNRLRDAGARVQRLLWASTSTKNPAYRDVLYVEELIGPNTVNTLPPETLEAFRDHGKVAPTLEANVADAEQELRSLDRLGISLDEVTAKLTVEGVKLFADAFDDLLGAIAKKRAATLGRALNGQTATLSPEWEKDVNATLEEWRKSGSIRRLWQGDATLWTGADEAKWLGWLDIVAEQRRTILRFEKLAADVKRENFTHAVLIGMGGSSLGVEVLAKTFGRQAGFPEFQVIDSTDPVQIRALESAVDLKTTLFIVSSKSGTTLEPNILMDYFFARVQSVVGAQKARTHFIAITDPGSKLAGVAAERRFRGVCLGKPNIGGRYSVLSDFGAAPAAIMGLDVGRFLGATETMVRACGAHVPPADNPGVQLGAIIGTLAKKGRDKLTVIASPGLAALGAWLEQLVAESTGKQGKGIIPLDGEDAGAPAVYGTDRLFVYLRLESDSDVAQADKVAKLEQAGQPVVRITVPAREQIGQEFFRWEIATAVAGAITGVNPFDQPHVEASKVKTRALTDAYEKSGALPPETPLLEDKGIKVFADEANAKILKQAGDSSSLVTSLKAHLSRLHAGDYCAVLAYLAMSQTHERALHDIRMMIRDRLHVATCVGFGPRFLHSTGQAYKGGPNTGVFLQVTTDYAKEIPVPERKYGFGVVIAAQARGDFAVLSELGRRALRLHLGADTEKGLATLKDAVRQALG
jgi:transaldolase/glucose-6-phosphate isomerase